MSIVLEPYYYRSNYTSKSFYKNYKIKISFSTKTTLRNLLGNPKTKIKEEERIEKYHVIVPYRKKTKNLVKGASGSFQKSPRR